MSGITCKAWNRARPGNGKPAHPCPAGRGPAARGSHPARFPFVAESSRHAACHPSFFENPPHPTGGVFCSSGEGERERERRRKKVAKNAEGPACGIPIFFCFLLSLSAARRRGSAEEWNTFP